MEFKIIRDRQTEVSRPAVSFIDYVRPQGFGFLELLIRAKAALVISEGKAKGEELADSQSESLKGLRRFSMASRKLLMGMSRV